MFVLWFSPLFLGRKTQAAFQATTFPAKELHVRVCHADGDDE